MATSMTKSLDVKTKDGVRFGRELRKDFLFDDKYLNLNHGSFGTYPRVIREQLRSFQDQAEARPDPFIRFKYPELLDQSREAVSKILNAPVETLAFVPNATTGVNTVLRNLVYKPGDHILTFSTIYGACDKTVAYITETTPAKCVRVEYAYPVEDDWLVEAFKQKIADVRKTGGNVPVAILDTVVSNPGVRVPFERLLKVCKQEGVLSCVDGAHGVGHIALDLTALDPDFFVSNCHKWLYAPRGCAVLYVPTRNQPLLRSTLPTSHGFMPIPMPGVKYVNPVQQFGDKSQWTHNFDYVGTIDSSPYLCVPAAIKYRESLGGEDVIMKYNSALAKEAAYCMAKRFGTEVLENKTKTLGECCMGNVRLPLDLAKVKATAVKAGIREDDVGATVRDWMYGKFIGEYGTFLAIFDHGGAWWVRLSGQVYLEMADFEKGAEIVEHLCARVMKGEFAAAKGKL